MHTGTYEYLRVTHGQHTGNIRIHNTLDSTERIKDDKIPHQKIKKRKIYIVKDPPLFPQQRTGFPRLNLRLVSKPNQREP